MEYVSRQREFWNVADLMVARFQRVLTLSAPSENEWQAHTARHLAILLADIEVDASWTILDIGCGVGRLLKPLKTFVSSGAAIGVDIAPEMLRFARTYLDDPEIPLLLTSGLDLLGVADASVDFAYAVDVFIHVFDIDVLIANLQEIHRVLKPGGVARFNVTYRDAEMRSAHNRKGVATNAFHRWEPADPTGFYGNLYTPEELEDIVGACGHWSSAEYTIQMGASIWCTLRK